MIPIYPKKCKKSNKSKKKGSGLRLYKKISLFKVLKSTKRTISYLLLFAWGYPSISRSLKFQQATYTFSDVVISVSDFDVSILLTTLYSTPSAQKNLQATYTRQKCRCILILWSQYNLPLLRRNLKERNLCIVIQALPEIYSISIPPSPLWFKGVLASKKKTWG